MDDEKNQIFETKEIVLDKVPVTLRAISDSTIFLSIELAIKKDSQTEYLKRLRWLIKTRMRNRFEACVHSATEISFIGILKGENLESFIKELDKAGFEIEDPLSTNDTK
jgi:hypothetical protein